MGIDINSLRSRRALLGSAFGAFAATVASAMGRPDEANAANPPVRLNQDNSATGNTSVTSAAGIAFQGAGTSSNTGIRGSSNSGTGVYGSSTSGTGVSGQSNSGIAVHGLALRPSGFAAAVFGGALSPGGVGSLSYNYATSGAAIGAQGNTDSPVGQALVGWAKAGGLGVVGFSGATFPSTPTKTGVFGRADQGASSVGVRGSSGTGRGGLFRGKQAQLRLAPSTANTHPASGAAGDLFVDKSHRLWFCKGGTSWKQLA